MRVIVIGGGISGLICANVLQKRGATIEVYEPRAIGGEFLTGGLKYIHCTSAVESFLDEYHIPYGNYRLKGGIMLRGEVRKYPNFLSKIDKIDAIRIQQDHYRKTRKMEPGEFGDTAMNDPANSKSRQALRCDFRHLIDVLASRVRITRTALKKVVSNKAFFENGSVRSFDYMVMTLPLWIIKRVADFEIPEAVAMNLNIAIVKSAKEVYSDWDYVYTPYTPADYIHRISPDEEGYAVEANGELDDYKLFCDLNYLFKEGWYVKTIRTGLKGHLLPLDGEIKVPKNIALVGRFAAWEPRMTVDVTLAKALMLSRRWLYEL